MSGQVSDSLRKCSLWRLLGTPAVSKEQPPRGVLQLQNPYDILLCKRNLADTHDPGTVRDIDRMQGRLFLCELTDGNACPQHNQHLKGRRLK